MKKLKASSPQSKYWLILWLLIFFLTFAWRAQNLDAFGPVNDEGAYLMWTRLAVDGYPLYAETRAVQPPLFFEWLGLAFRLAGQSTQTGRWAMLIGYVPLAVALSWLAHRVGGRSAALAAMLLLGLAPLSFTYSRLVMADVSATGLAVVSLALLLVFLDSGHQGWLFASGVALGLSLLTKALNPFMIVPIGLLLLWPSLDEASWHWRQILLNGLVWGLGTIVPLVIICFIYDPKAMYDQIIAIRGDLRAAIPGSWSEKWNVFAIFLKSHWGFWLLAFGGIIATVLRVYLDNSEHRLQTANRNDRYKRFLSLQPSPFILFPVMWLVWLIAAVAMLVWHTPLFYQHLVVLLPPLILLGAGFLADTLVFWRTGQITLAAKIILTIIIVAAAFNLPSIAKANQKTAAIVTGGRETEALALLQAVSHPDDFLMGDSQLLIFMAGRRTPPPLGDVALVAIKAGRQTADRMIRLNQEYQAPAVVQWSLRLPWLPEYLSWVEANYLARREWDNDHIIYFVPRLLSARLGPNERAVRLGDTLTWRGYQIDEASLAAGGRDLKLKVYWQADASLAEDYTVFTQLLDKNGTLVVGWDSQPLGGYFPTGQWPPQEIVTDLVRLPLPSELPPGDYTLITGMYLLDTFERLLTPDGSDHIVVTTINIE